MVASKWHFSFFSKFVEKYVDEYVEHQAFYRRLQEPALIYKPKSHTLPGKDLYSLCMEKFEREKRGESRLPETSATPGRLLAEMALGE
jgi:hypothetical protein